jgi:hypothetical protein
LADVSRSSQRSPRTPAGPSETTRRRRPTSGSGCSDQKSAPVSKRTFCSSERAATRAANSRSDTGTVSTVCGVTSAFYRSRGRCDQRRSGLVDAGGAAEASRVERVLKKPPPSIRAYSALLGSPHRRAAAHWCGLLRAGALYDLAENCSVNEASELGSSGGVMTLTGRPRPSTRVGRSRRSHSERRLGKVDMSTSS